MCERVFAGLDSDCVGVICSACGNFVGENSVDIEGSIFLSD